MIVHQHDQGTNIDVVKITRKTAAHVHARESNVCASCSLSNKTFCRAHPTRTQLDKLHVIVCTLPPSKHIVVSKVPLAMHMSIAHQVRSRARFLAQNRSTVYSGLCCHLPESDNGMRVCVSHDLPARAVCRDSCQCSSGLHCFQTVCLILLSFEHSPPTTTRSLFVQANKTDIHCKDASAQDILLGDYLNQPHSYFEMGAL